MTTSFPEPERVPADAARPHDHAEHDSSAAAAEPTEVLWDEPAGASATAGPAAPPAAAPTPTPTPAPAPAAVAAPSGPHVPAILLGIVCVAVAGLVLAQELGDLTLDWGDIGPLGIALVGGVLVLFGLLGLASSRRRDG